MFAVLVILALSALNIEATDAGTNPYMGDGEFALDYPMPVTLEEYNSKAKRWDERNIIEKLDKDCLRQCSPDTNTMFSMSNKGQDGKMKKNKRNKSATPMQICMRFYNTKECQAYFQR